MVLSSVFQSSERAEEVSMKAIWIDSDYITLNTEILNFVHWNDWSSRSWYYRKTQWQNVQSIEGLPGGNLMITDKFYQCVCQKGCSALRNSINMICVWDLFLSSHLLHVLYVCCFPSAREGKYITLLRSSSSCFSTCYNYLDWFK